MFASLPDMDLDEVDKVLLIGGSSKISYFKEALEDYFPKELVEELNDDDEHLAIVARGAAKYLEVRDTANITIINRIPFAIGYRKDNRVRRVLDRNRAWGDKTSGTFDLDTAELVRNKGELAIYQHLADTVEASLEKDKKQAIFMESLKLDLAKYKPGEKIYIGMYLDTTGALVVELKQFAPAADEFQDDEFKVIESFRIKMGSYNQS